MNESSLMKKELTAAEDLLSRRAKLTKAIEGEVSKLPALIETREAAERNFATHELAQAVGEASTDTALTKARAAVTASRAAIDEVAAKLRRLRGALSEFGGELAERHEKLSAAIPAFNQDLERAFAVEWSKAHAAFSVVLGQRQAIEALTGNPMSLPDPTPTPADLGAAAKPYQVLNEIAAGIKTIAAAARTAAAGPWIDPYTRTPTPYDFTAIYVMKKPFGGVQEGSYVVDATFEEGRLQQLVGSHWAVPALTAEKRRAAHDARLAADRIRQAELDETRRRDLAAQAALDKDLLAEQERRRPGSTTRETSEQANARRQAEADAELSPR